MEIKITYEEITTLVNQRYRDLENNGEKNIHQTIKDEFNLTTSELWEILGIKDELGFFDYDQSRPERIRWFE